MSTSKHELEHLFNAACELDSDQRRAFLDAACDQRPEMRSEIEDMLRRDESAKSFLAGPAIVSPGETLDRPPISERPGAQIGQYKLMEQIGEGGFGLVFIARQEQPVRRDVALKIIKPGMDTRDVIARFEAERQALALMDHPNIAKVFDAGTTDTGRPFFVMELVKGIPIVDYCDQHELTPRERIELMLSVCRAVQHAHSKGVIHRDLKPSNVLVSPHDGIPVVKVIDFGIAKAIGQQLTDKTIFTRFAQMIGTPTYMSPEQAEINALDVDIRSDVYSLGVLIYELLTGTTPFERHRFATAAYDEIRKIIREEDPPKPSARLSTLGGGIAKLSAQRRTEPAKLSSTVKGELDWIVMCCLEKDRSRRYETAASLAQDLNRFLQNEPIEACPPSVTYRTRKLLRRHRMPLAIATLFSVLCVTGIVITARQNIVIRRQMRIAEEALRSFREVALQQGISEVLTGDPERARSAIELAKQADVSHNWTELFSGLLATYEGRYENAVNILQPLSETDEHDSNQLCALASLAYNHVCAGHDPEYLRCMERIPREIPKTAEERLFVALAYSMSDPERVRKLLSDTSENTQYPLALGILGGARAWYALRHMDADALSGAMQDVRYAERFSGDTPFLLHTKAVTWQIADEFARIQGDNQARETHCQELSKIVDQLSAAPTSRLIQNVKIGIFDRLDRFDNVLAVVRSMDFGDTVLIEYGAASIYAHTDARTGLQLLEDLRIDADNPHGLVARAHFISELPGLRNEMISLYERIVAENQEPLQAKMRALSILALAGEGERMKKDAKALLAKSKSAHLDNWGMRESLLLAAGEWEPSQLDTVDSILTRCTGFYHLALKQLSEGDRPGAKKSLMHCLNTGVFTFFEYNWAKAYLRKMDSDPTWPAGIEASKSTTPES